MVAKEDKPDEVRDSATGRVRAGAPRAAGDSAVSSGNVGNALRSVYDQTVGEDVPDEMLALLGKLS